MIWEYLLVHHEYEQYKESHHMPTVNQERYMASSTHWGTNIVGAPTHNNIPQQQWPTMSGDDGNPRYMREVYIRGTNGSGMPILLHPRIESPLANGDGTYVKDGTNVDVGYQYHNQEDTDQLYTSSARINSQLVAQAKSQWYQDIPRGPIMKWLPASPGQPVGGYGGHTDPASLDPRLTYRDQYRPMGHSHMDFWQTCRHHLVWIVLFIVVGSILLEYGHWTYPHKESEVSE